jgi:tRNA U38,U39,U40 pseudouridine synthase TruA
LEGGLGYIGIMTFFYFYFARFTISTAPLTSNFQQKMQKAASKFIGEHDFRNFCKMDAVNVSNYKRRITDFDISAYDQRLNLYFSQTLLSF